LEEVIAAWNLTKEYDGLLAVDHVSFEVNRGEVFGFLGPNGAGKTSTIRMLVGLTEPSEGSASVAGYDIRKEIVEVKRRVGVVPETSNLYDELTAGENLLFASQLYNVPRGERPNRIKELLERFHLTDRRDTKFGKLSRGLKRRVVIAAALVHRPEIIFMDEPTTGLDVVSARSLRKYIQELQKEGTTVFLTTHYIEEADQLADRIALIVKGNIVTVDTPERIKDKVKGTPIVEAVLSREPNKLMIKKLRELGSVDWDERRISITTGNVMVALESLIHLAKQEDLEVQHIQTLRPSLEDAFVELTGVSAESMMSENSRGRR
jgi:ABC-2 type transport system ATP-binding protein